MMNGAPITLTINEVENEFKHTSIEVVIFKVTVANLGKLTVSEPKT